MKFLMIIIYFVCIFAPAFSAKAQSAKILGRVQALGLEPCCPQEGFRPEITATVGETTIKNQKSDSDMFFFETQVGSKIKITVEANGYKTAYREIQNAVPGVNPIDHPIYLKPITRHRSDLASVRETISSILNTARTGNIRISVYNLMLLKVLYQNSEEILNLIKASQTELENIFKANENNQIAPSSIFNDYEKIIRKEKGLIKLQNLNDINYFDLLNNPNTPSEIKYKVINFLPEVSLDNLQKNSVINYLRTERITPKDFLFQVSLETLAKIGTLEDKNYVLEGLNQINDQERLIKSLRVAGKANLVSSVETIRNIALANEDNLEIMEPAIKSLEIFAKNQNNLASKLALIELTENKNTSESLLLLITEAFRGIELNNSLRDRLKESLKKDSSLNVKLTANGIKGINLNIQTNVQQQ